MKILITEDDSVSLKLLQSILSPHGEVDTAVNGLEGLKAFQKAWKALKPYDLICLDIMMPEMDGQELLKRIRSSENDMGVPEVKIIMTTALDDSKNIMTAFRNQCEAYLVKPIRREKVEEHLRAFGFLA